MAWANLSGNLKFILMDEPKLMPKKLFGGALQVALPSGFIDASQFRQIPDHQEVYLSQDSETSIIVELLDPLVEQKNAMHVLDSHFQILAEDNSCSFSLILQKDLELNILLGVQAVPKFGKKTDFILVLLSVRSLEAPYNTDIVTSMNVNILSDPLFSTTLPSSIGALAELNSNSALQSLTAQTPFKRISENAFSTFSRICQSIEVLDYSLFQTQ
ncbi:hypothetical protein DI09_53p50 [Mitosporidium daphniae]|uniref:Uncharacterized protein n=1 Tax=Mitosporidium daphniae TaxID=1485682 RepID=A0A098VP86_9MICR|nr:uncharacterized protein DI09_53p50 [Mitosporidium daphniae]KGG50833.1 hypothetical protein DI09_53p50 [Mitosporidium daphniae]|eukprot:XP_013237276.1 uncharacterized protein DI09_53p50 [Mitosporidium daphniae]